MDDLERDLLFPLLPECGYCGGQGTVDDEYDADLTCPVCGGSGFEETDSFDE